MKVAGLTKELLADLDKLFPEKTPEVNMDMKEIYFRIGQRSVVRFLHQLMNHRGAVIEPRGARVCGVWCVVVCGLLASCANS